jgi:hypothetical protein
MRVVEKSKMMHMSLSCYNTINKKPTCIYYNNKLLKDYIETYTNDIVVIIVGYMDPGAWVEQNLMPTLEHIPWIVQALS